jgi:hypothetical protein
VVEVIMVVMVVEGEEEEDCYWVVPSIVVMIDDVEEEVVVIYHMIDGVLDDSVVVEGVEVVDDAANQVHYCDVPAAMKEELGDEDGEEMAFDEVVDQEVKSVV